MLLFKIIRAIPNSKPLFNRNEKDNDMNYYHVDVFSAKAMRGNGLTVVFPSQEYDDDCLLSIAREFKQFETVFVFERNADGSFPVRIFTVEEELNFAGHPIVGLGAVLHSVYYTATDSVEIKIDLRGREITVSSKLINGVYNVTMNQGTPQFLGQVDQEHCDGIARSLNLSVSDLDGNFPVEVVSTGLPYLLVPLKSGLDRAKISMNSFEDFLGGFGAKFVYVFDTRTLECRTWDNLGAVEDVATGSAAGPLCAYMVKHGLAEKNKIVEIHQGRFVQRPSVIQAWVSANAKVEVFISGDVAFFASGNLSI
jgi:PhzF family phenazine biosynthesis protein